MGDKVFQWSLTGLTVLVVVWLVVGILFYILPGILVVLSSLVVELVVGGILVYRWGKGYMSRGQL